MWIQDVFQTDKPVIGMLHLLPLPGDPDYDPEGGIEKIIARAEADVKALQNGGIDGILVCNEYSLPYLNDVEPVTVATMAYLIGRLDSILTVPYGCDVALDPYKVFDLAAAAKCRFVRETFSGAYAGDFGVMSYELGKVQRHRSHVGAKGVRMFATLVPECSLPLADRSWEDVAKSTAFYLKPDVFLVSGLVAGFEADDQIVRRVKKAVSTPVFANNGVRLENIDRQLDAADGCIVGTSLKKDGQFYEPVDEARVTALMKRAREIRGEA